MAVVYRARDTQLLRDVAVKVLHPHLANEVESRQRFLREAQAAARLRHPNIVEVFDFSVVSDRDSYMVTELLEGPTLRKFAEPHLPMAAEIVAAIGIVLCDALDCAHSQGVTHRDVKPDNVLLDKGGLLKLTDFGIAHVADSGSMTVTGQILGSPAHMAPEQIEGTSVDARTDLFSLGTVLYLLSVGRLPFEAPVAHALLRKILEADYVDSLRAQPQVGQRFAQIIRKCMAREPKDRYENAKELRKELSEFCAEIGWDDSGEKLRAFIENPTQFAAAHRALLIEKLPTLGERAQKQKRVTDALGYFNRALALDPSNARVLKLVRGVALRRRRERTLKAAAVVAVSAAVSASIGGLAVAILRGKTQHRTVTSAPNTMLQNGHVLQDAAGGLMASAAERSASQDASSSQLRALSVEPDAAAVVAMAADASAPIVVAASSQAGARNSNGGNSSNARVIANASANSHAPTGASSRLVLLNLRTGIALKYSIDGGPEEFYYRPLTLTLRVGRHSVALIPNTEGQCARQQWVFTVPNEQASDALDAEHRLPIETPFRFGCHEVNRGTTASVP